MATTTKTPATPHGPGLPLDELRAALFSLGKDLRTGGRDLFGDVETLASSGRRDIAKLTRALRADTARLAKVTTQAPPPRRQPARKSARRAAAHPKKAAA